MFHIGSLFDQELNRREPAIHRGTYQGGITALYYSVYVDIHDIKYICEYRHKYGIILYRINIYIYIIMNIYVVPAIHLPYWLPFRAGA